MKTTKFVSFIAALFLLVALGTANAGEVSKDLIKSVASLAIGHQGYVIGQNLTDEQFSLAKQNLENDAYPGTYKFKHTETSHVVATEHDNMVLAVYEELEDASAEDFKALLAELMDEFGEPTAMAHDKIIYWVYGSQGKINEQDFLQAKETGKLDALVTVKLNSSERFQAVSKGDKEKADAYFLISSQPILQGFIGE